MTSPQYRRLQRYVKSSLPSTCARRCERVAGVCRSRTSSPAKSFRSLVGAGLCARTGARGRRRMDAAVTKAGVPLQLSARKATTGSMAEVRRAGRYVARTAIAASPADAARR